MAFTTNDNAPYLYRKSGGGGDLEIDKLVGGTIAWNQLIKNGNFADTSNWVVFSGMTFTVSGNVATVTPARLWDHAFQPFDWTYGHVMLAISNVKKIGESGEIRVKVVNNFGYTNNDFSRSITANDTWTDIVMCGKYTMTPSGSTAQVKFGVQEYRSANASNGFQIKNVMICDLTLMFGSTIADYVYSLEQSSQGSGLAWLRSYGFFTEDYYDYNSGELKSVSNLVSHDMTGKNLLDTSTAEIGTAWNGASNSARARLVIPLAVGQTYTLRVNGTSTLDTWYGIETNTIPPTSAGVALSNPYTFTATTKYLSLGFNKTAIASSDIEALKLQLELGSTATSYEPYTLHSYPLGDVTLRGLPKLNGNALYYDGDTYESNGTVTRKYGIVTLNGSESWRMNVTTYNGYVSMNSVKRVSNYKLSMVSSYLPVERQAGDLSTSEMPSWVSAYYNSSVSLGQNWIYVHIDGITTVDGLKAYLANKPLTVVYELASSTTETADTYTNPQWVDPNGTERYTLSSNAFPMPVGHETTYNTDMGSKTVNTQVNLSMTEPQVRQVYAKEGDTARVLNIHLDQTEEDGTLRILRPDGTEVTADAVLVPDFYDGLMAEIPSDATEIVGKCYCDVEQNGVSSMPFTLNVKKNERQ